MNNTIKLTELSVCAAHLSTLSKHKLNARISEYTDTNKLKAVEINDNNVVIDGIITVIAALALGLDEVQYRIADKNITVKNLVKCSEIRLEKVLDNYTGINYTIIEQTDAQKIYEAQNHNCYLCGKPITLRVDKRYEFELAAVSYKIPLEAGGTRDKSNVGLSCHRCNELKGKLVYTPELKAIIRKQRENESGR